MAIETQLLKKLFEDAISKAKINGHIPNKSDDKNKELVDLANFLMSRKEFHSNEHFKLSKSTLKHIWNSNGLGKNSFDIKIKHTEPLNILSRYVSDNFAKNWNEWVSLEQNKRHDSTTETTDTLPTEIFGIYECYFLRPETSDKEEHISKLILVISKPNSVNAKSTAGTYYNSIENKCFYKSKEKILTLRFEGRSDITGELHRFQFNLKYIPNRNENAITLKGIYSGSDPNKGEPVAGKAMLFKVENSLKNDELDLDSIVKKYKVEDFFDTQEISDLFKVRQELFNFFVSRNFINSGETLKNYLGAVDSKISLICGSFSIYSLTSDNLFLNRGVMKIDQLGNVRIKGSSNRLYSGYIKVFDEKFISIIIDNYSEPHEGNKPFYMHYLLESGLSLQSPSQPSYFVGVRTILYKNTNKTPGAGRVIIQKEIKSFYDNNTFCSYRIRPYTINKGVILKDLSKKFKSFYDINNFSKESPKKVTFKQKLDYLGIRNKSMITSSLEEIFENSEKEDIGSAYFLLSWYFAAQENNEEFKKYFQLALINGFNGDDALKLLQYAKSSSNNPDENSTNPLLELIQTFTFAKQKFFTLKKLNR